MEKKSKKDEVQDVEVNVDDFRLHEKDTGSADVQIVLLSKRIKNLSEHLKKHKKDFSTRRGLLSMVARRRKLLKFLNRDNQERYKKVVSDLSLRV